MLSDEELIQEIERVIENGNLNELTVKKIFQHFENKFPDQDLSEKKEFIRVQIKELAKKKIPRTYYQCKERKFSTCKK